MLRAEPLGIELASSHWGACEVVRDASGGPVGVLGQQRQFRCGHVGSVHPRGGLHESVPVLGDQGAAFAGQHPDRLLVVYPNSGELWDSARSCWCCNRTGGSDFTSGEDAVAAMVRGWHEAGADVIGSCCRTTPDTTQLIRKILSEK